MRCIKAWVAILTLAVTDRCWAHSDEAMGHHWEIPAYGTEMHTQILMMTGIAVAVMAALWIARHVKERRSRQ